MVTKVKGDKVLDWYAKNKFLVGMTVEFPLLLPAAAYTALTVLTALKEEQPLKQRFGKQYQAYAARVPWRFIPGVV